MRLVLYLTLIQTAFGMAVVQCFVPRNALGPGFGKTISTSIFFCLLFPMLAAGWLLPFDPVIITMVRGIGAIALLLWFAYFVILNYPREGLLRAIATVATIVQMSLLILTARALAVHFFRINGTEGYGPTFKGLNLSLSLGIISASMLLGSVTMGMLIGHWYLVIPGLDIKWLKNACLLFAGALGLRIGAVAISMMIGAYSDPFGPEGFLDSYVLRNLPLFVPRLVVGLLIPLPMCWMAYAAAVIRSTQSSTGILFPTMIVVFLGEMIGTAMITGLTGLYM